MVCRDIHLDWNQKKTASKFDKPRKSKALHETTYFLTFFIGKPTKRIIWSIKARNGVELRLSMYKNIKIGLMQIFWSKTKIVSGWPTGSLHFFMQTGCLKIFSIQKLLPTSWKNSADCYTIHSHIHTRGTEDIQCLLTPSVKQEVEERTH